MSKCCSSDRRRAAFSPNERLLWAGDGPCPSSGRCFFPRHPGYRRSILPRWLTNLARESGVERAGRTIAQGRADLGQAAIAAPQPVSAEAHSPAGQIGYPTHHQCQYIASVIVRFPGSSSVRDCDADLDVSISPVDGYTGVTGPTDAADGADLRPWVVLDVRRWGGIGHREAGEIHEVVDINARPPFLSVAMGRTIAAAPTARPAMQD